MGIGTAIGLGGAAVGAGIVGSHGAKSAANAQVAAADQAAQLQFQEAQQALDFEKQVFAQQQVNQAPWLQGGSSAMVNLANLMGILPSTYNSTPVPMPEAQSTTVTDPFATRQAQLTVPLPGTNGSVSGAQSSIPMSPLLAGVNPADFSARLLPGFGTPPSGGPSGALGTPGFEGGPVSNPNQQPGTIGPGGITSVGGPNGPPITPADLGAPQTGQGASGLQSILDRLPGRAQPMSGAIEMPIDNPNGGGPAGGDLLNQGDGSLNGPGAAAAPMTQPPANPAVPLSSLVNPSLGASGSLMNPWPFEFQAPTDVTEQNDPGFQFRLQQGQQALENSAAARGGLLSGGTAKALERYAQDYGSNEYQNVFNRSLTDYQQAYNQFQQAQANQFNRLAAIAGIGQTSAGQLNSAGAAAAQNTGNILLGSGSQIGNDLMAAGNARASGYLNQANALNGTLGNLVSLFGFRG